jgi:hypothetical protein
MATAGFAEDGNEPSGFIQMKKKETSLNYYQLIKEVSSMESVYTSISFRLFYVSVATG